MNSELSCDKSKVIIPIKWVNVFILLILMGVVVESQLITDHSPLVGYKYGKTYFTIYGTGFSLEDMRRPELYLGSTKQSLLKSDLLDDGVTFKFVFFLWNPKGKDSYSISLRQDGNIIFSGFIFNFISPIVDSITPEFYYPRGFETKILTITGKNLLLEDDDEINVNFVDVDERFPLKVISASRTEIQCYIPNYREDKNKVFNVFIYPEGLSQGVQALYFSYEVPSLFRVRPSRSISNSNQITIFGKSFVDDRNNFIIIIGGQICPVQKITPNWVICQFTHTDPIPDGQNELDLPIIAVIDGQSVKGILSFVIYRPIVSSIYPLIAYSNTKFQISINGRYLGESDFASFGNVGCQATQRSDTQLICIFDTTGTNIIGSYPLELNIGGNQISFDDKIFTFIGKPTIIDIQPKEIYRDGVWYLNIQTEHLPDFTDVLLNGQHIDSKLVSYNLLKIELNIEKLGLPIGDHTIELYSSLDGSILSPPMIFSVVDPIITMTPTVGYVYSETEIEVEYSNLPFDLFSNDHMTIRIKDTKVDSKSIRIIDKKKFSFLVPPKLDGPATVEISILFHSYHEFLTILQFTYYEPTFTLFEQDDENFAISGLHLDFITSIQIGTEYLLDMSTCSIFSEDRILCDIPYFFIGSYPVTLFVTDSFSIDHEYQDEFSNDPNQVQVIVGDVECHSVQILDNGNTISCILPELKNVGIFNVFVIVDGIKSDANIEYKSDLVSCLGQRPTYGVTNEVVDWWFIYKIAKSETESYLYIDSTMDQLKLFDNLQHLKPFDQMPLSPLESTVMQPATYHIYYNDQIGGRDDWGGRIEKKANDGTIDDRYGHSKGISLWDEVDGQVFGIHIQHSNPIFPSYEDKGDGMKFNTPYEGIKFLGKNVFSQHFFCYNTDNMEQVAEYMVKNSVKVFSSNVFKDIVKSPRMENYKYMYNLIKKDSSWSKIYRDACEKNIRNGNDNLDNICYWNSEFTTIGNDLKMKYFMKIGNNYYREDGLFENPTRSKYILKKRTGLEKFNNVYHDGVDLWMVVADHFKKKMFVQMSCSNVFTKDDQYKIMQMRPTEQVINVAHLELPQYLSPKSKYGKYITNRFASAFYEHSKLGFPVYPTYSTEVQNDNEDNYFCVGDSNRHNGQGQRAGGIICFYHPTLVYQFNRMVRKYDTYNLLGEGERITLMTSKDSIGLFFTMQQPVLFFRVDQHPLISLEIKDYINDQYFSKYPKQNLYLDKIPPKGYCDIILELQVLRTSKENVAPKEEQSISSVQPNTFPEQKQQDIKDYVANDIYSVHYIAFDEKVGSICDFRDDLIQCSKENARVTPITKPQTQVSYPPLVNDQKTWDLQYSLPLENKKFVLENNDDFRLIRFTSKFMTMFENPKRNFYQFVFAPSLSNHFNPPTIYRSELQSCYEEEIAYFMTLHYIYYQANVQNQISFSIGTNEPNWANGVIFAISKKLFNNFRKSDTSLINSCFTVVPGFSDISNKGDVDMDDSVFKTNARAAWAMMCQDNNYANSGRTSNDIIPPSVLLNAMIKMTKMKSQSIDSLSSLYWIIPSQYRTIYNFKICLEKNRLETRMIDDTELGLLNLMKLKSFDRSNSLLSSNNQNSISSISKDESESKSGVQQLISTNLLNSSDITSLSIYQTMKLELSFDKWISINGQSQAIQTLIVDPFHQYHNQPIKFIEELNYYQPGNNIKLQLQSVGTTGTRITLSSPLSIVSITFILESLLKTTSKTSFGDFEVFYHPKPVDYIGYITNDFDGMIISTINSQLCDIQMINQQDYQSNRFDSICSGVGPIITSVNQLTGPTNGGYKITINGIRFNSSMIVSIGEKPCHNNELLSTQQLVCQVPNGVGSNHEIIISTQQTIFNIQRSKFIFSYQPPIITGIQPKILNCHGNDNLTISGSNFGMDAMNLQVLIDETLFCQPIISVDSESIVCLTPSAIGDYRSITVFVDDQRSIFNIDTVQQQSFNFDGPKIMGFLPPFGDPNDKILIFGNGFGNEEDSDLPPLVYIGDNQVQINNYTNGRIEFQLEFESSNQSLIVQSGDQSTISEFHFNPASSDNLLISNFKTTGGLIGINGSGFGLFYDDGIEIHINSIVIPCSSFNEFIECFIPPGIGKNLSLSVVALSYQPEILENYTISYFKPQITSVKYKDSIIQIFGSNFVPVDLGVSYNPSDSFIKLVYNDRNVICTTFRNSKLAECEIGNIDNEDPITIEIMVGGQLSNIYSFH
ncbi:hypothetical protein PPL_08812 [Heterostelium album PN500]|uniref:IPT/TIG domain-containing protein n=1 Tax=Heterostelium pallidum (strain ATCC 26659 / Pp 5 / PN500) TaxID=670386 RepID=D3BJT2_HETP5|nr:hypothetical protein PPL_08812 [Heterostelium album PN500]EFA78162.1 hypothetical protein PPL_08812 [Heterostelium album PN500]|eukprot:XP_020430288.1 hypothetical protein PPL_08812 [Heterostelium album PN500]